MGSIPIELPPRLRSRIALRPPRLTSKDTPWKRPAQRLLICARFVASCADPAARRPRNGARSPSCCRASMPIAQQGPLDLAQLFGRDARRVLDIGFGDGEALVTNAMNNPTVDYFGIEVHEPGIGHLLLLLEQAAVTNVRIIARDAADVRTGAAAAGELRRRRPFLSGPVAEEASSQTPPRAAAVRRGARARAEAGGLLHVATDWADYARHTREVLATTEPVRVRRADRPRQPIRSRYGRRRSSSAAACGSVTTSPTFTTACSSRCSRRSRCVASRGTSRAVCRRIGQTCAHHEPKEHDTRQCDDGR